MSSDYIQDRLVGEPSLIKKMRPLEPTKSNFQNNGTLQGLPNDVLKIIFNYLSSQEADSLAKLSRRMRGIRKLCPEPLKDYIKQTQIQINEKVCFASSFVPYLKSFTSIHKISLNFNLLKKFNGKQQRLAALQSLSQLKSLKLEFQSLHRIEDIELLANVLKTFAPSKSSSDDGLNQLEKFLLRIENLYVEDSSKKKRETLHIIKERFNSILRAASHLSKLSIEIKGDDFMESLDDRHLLLKQLKIGSLHFEKFFIATKQIFQLQSLSICFSLHSITVKGFLNLMETLCKSNPQFPLLTSVKIFWGTKDCRGECPIKDINLFEKFIGAFPQLKKFEVIKGATFFQPWNEESIIFLATKFPDKAFRLSSPQFNKIMKDLASLKPPLPETSKIDGLNYYKGPDFFKHFIYAYEEWQNFSKSITIPYQTLEVLAKALFSIEKALQIDSQDYYALTLKLNILFKLDSVIEDIIYDHTHEVMDLTRFSKEQFLLNIIVSVLNHECLHTSAEELSYFWENTEIRVNTSDNIPSKQMFFLNIKYIWGQILYIIEKIGEKGAQICFEKALYLLKLGRFTEAYAIWLKEEDLKKTPNEINTYFTFLFDKEPVVNTRDGVAKPTYRKILTKTIELGVAASNDVAKPTYPKLLTKIIEKIRSSKDCLNDAESSLICFSPLSNMDFVNAIIFQADLVNQNPQSPLIEITLRYLYSKCLRLECDIDQLYPLLQEKLNPKQRGFLALEGQKFSFKLDVLQFISKSGHNKPFSSNWYEQAVQEKLDSSLLKVVDAAIKLYIRIHVQYFKIKNSKHCIENSVPQLERGLSVLQKTLPSSSPTAQCIKEVFTNLISWLKSAQETDRYYYFTLHDPYFRETAILDFMDSIPDYSNQSLSPNQYFEQMTLEKIDLLKLSLIWEYLFKTHVFTPDDYKNMPASILSKQLILLNEIGEKQKVKQVLLEAIHYSKANEEFVESKLLLGYLKMVEQFLVE
ncbi:MAG: hypothetical protein K0S74_1662 [Chlamydiales bacterium]|jgi:hypothetical protein|nr:hypothetical protein [Chlamydiales bacterium]